MNNKQVLVFVYKHGGTGKTFLCKTIIHGLGSEGRIVLAVASSGIASFLLPMGCSVHLRFKLPLNPTDSKVCSIKKNTQLATLIKETCLIIWDESPINDRLRFETLERTLRDLLDPPKHLFGGKTVMLGGDFRKTLPMMNSLTRDEITSLLVTESYLWHHFKLHYLTKNMRLSHRNLQKVNKENILTFAQWLLDIGNGHIGTPNEVDPENTSWIDIPKNYCIPDDKNGISNLIKFIYDDVTQSHHRRATGKGRVRTYISFKMPFSTVTLEEKWNYWSYTVLAVCLIRQRFVSSEDIQCAGSDIWPPMLDRIDFASWQQRIRLYCWEKENGVNILKSIDEEPFQMGTFRETLAEGEEGTLHLGPE
nr:DNA helicase [Tanacetum cinerariifolium]